MQAACKLGFPVLYGDGSRPAVLQTAGIAQPKAVMVMYTGRQKSVQSVERLRQAFPQVPIYARAQDLQHLLELKHAGITDCILENAETSLQLGSVLLRGLGVMSDDVRFLRRMMRESMELRAQETVEKKEHKETDWLVPFQTKVRQTWKNRNLKDDSVTKDKELINEQAYWVRSGGAAPSTDSYLLDDEERNSDEKLPLLFANKKPATDVKVSATGVLNGSALSGEDGPTSSSAVAVASPSGMILEQEPQPGAADQELDSETEGLIVTVKPSDTEPTPSASPSVQPASMGMAKLKWRMRTTPESDTSNLSSEDLDERGVTLCALEEDERYERDLEEGEELEKLDITITALNREESN